MPTPFLVPGDRTELPMPTSNRPSPPLTPLSLHHLPSCLPTILSQTCQNDNDPSCGVGTGCTMTRQGVLLLYNSVFDANRKVLKNRSHTRSESQITTSISPPFEKLRAQLQNVIEGARLESQALIDMVAAPRVHQMSAENVKVFRPTERSELKSRGGEDFFDSPNYTPKRVPLLESEHMELTQANDSNLPEVMGFLLAEHEPSHGVDRSQLRQCKRAVIAAIKVQCAWRCFMRRQKYSWVLQRQMRQLRADSTRIWLLGERHGVNIFPHRQVV